MVDQTREKRCSCDLFFPQLVLFVLAHMGKGKKKDKMEELLISDNFKVSFMKYNWDLNSKH